MASHHQITVRPRSLAVVLADLEEANRDYDDALASDDADAEDRATEAETRVSDLRDEFAERFVEATGLTWKQVEAAISEALI